MWLREHAHMTMACVYVLVLGAVAVLVARAGVQAHGGAHRRMADACATYAIGALAWPIAWSAVCGASLSTMPRIALLGLAWPPILLMVDALFIQHQVDADHRKSAQAIQFDGNALSGMALAIGGLLARYVSGGYAEAASPMFMATILLVFMVVLPQPVLHADSPQAGMVQAVQKVALQYCLGFILTAVAIVLAVGLARSDRQGVALTDAMAGKGEIAS